MSNPSLTRDQWNAIDAAAIALEQEIHRAWADGADTMTLASMKSRLDMLNAMLDAAADTDADCADCEP